MADGMDVINLSLGEPEIEPSRDIVVKAIDGAARAGVVPAIAAGNDFDGFGRGSVGSPGSAPLAITVAAAKKSLVIANFSSGGPTPVSLQMKPDVTAPGDFVLSSVPANDGLWASWSGTSMASPHVAGAAALLKQIHPAWTVAQIKSALVLTGTPVYTGSNHATETTSAREGGGFIKVPRANDPLIFASPTGLSFGLLRGGATSAKTVTLSNAGGGTGSWQVSVDLQQGAAGSVRVPASVAVPGLPPGNRPRPDAAGRGHRLRRPDEGRRKPPYPILVPFGDAAAAQAEARQAQEDRDVQGQYEGTPLAGQRVPLPRESVRRRHPREPRRARAGLHRSPDQAGRELRRGDPQPEPGCRDPAPGGGERRREPADRLSRAAAQPQPLRAELLRPRAGSRRDPPGQGPLRRRLRLGLERSTRASSRSASGSTT